MLGRARGAASTGAPVDKLAAGLQADLDFARGSRRRPDEPLIEGAPDPVQNVTIEDTLEEEFELAELAPQQKVTRHAHLGSCGPLQETGLAAPLRRL